MWSSSQNDRLREQSPVNMVWLCSSHKNMVEKTAAVASECVVKQPAWFVQKDYPNRPMFRVERGPQDIGFSHCSRTRALSFMPDTDHKCTLHHDPARLFDEVAKFLQVRDMMKFATSPTRPSWSFSQRRITFTASDSTTSRCHSGLCKRAWCTGWTQWILVSCYWNGRSIHWKITATNITLSQMAMIPFSIRTCVSSLETTRARMLHGATIRMRSLHAERTQASCGCHPKRGGSHHAKSYLVMGYPKA